MRTGILVVLLTLLSPAPRALAGPFDSAMAIVEDARRLATERPEAKRLLEQTVQSNPKHVHAWYNLGLLAMTEGNWDAAEAAWKQAKAAQSDYGPALARLAQVALVRGQAKAAVAALKAIIDKDAGGDPYQAEARNILAEIAIDREDWDTARIHARNVLLGDADNLNAYLNLAVTYYRVGLTDQALLIVDNALQRRDDAAALHNMMGLIWLRKDYVHKATESFIKALERNPALVEAKLNLAALELSYGAFQNALDRFDQVLAIRGGDPMLLVSRGVALRGLERHEEALSAYEQALQLRPGMPEVLYNLCVLHHQYTSNWEQALQTCQQYAATLTRRHPKRKEIKKRLRAIKATIKALATPPPADDDLAPEGDEGDTPAPEAEGSPE